MFNTHNMKFDSTPFDHWVIDNFLDSVDAEKLSKELSTMIVLRMLFTIKVG